MKILDLTHHINEGMPVYPGTEPPKVEAATTIEMQGFEERLLTMYSHTGTHMDAPCHIIKGGKSLSDFDVADFYGKAVALDVRGLTEISADDVAPYMSAIENADFAVLYSDWSRHWGDRRYFSGFPVLTTKAAELLAATELKGVCMDTISVDNADTETFDNHRVILGAGKFIVENLTGLSRLPHNEFMLGVMPLKIYKGDGAPVRAFAVCQEEEDAM